MLLFLLVSEAEYVAMAQRAKTALFTKTVLDFLEPELANETIDLFEDNQGAIAISRKPNQRGADEARRRTLSR